MAALMDKVQECVTKCIPQLGDLFSPASEFGPNLAAWSPLTLSAIFSSPVALRLRTIARLFFNEFHAKPHNHNSMCKATKSIKLKPI